MKGRRARRSTKSKTQNNHNGRSRQPQVVMKVMKRKTIKKRKPMKKQKKNKKKNNQKKVMKVGKRLTVWRGKAKYTKGKRLDKTGLIKNKYGKVVSKRVSENSKKTNFQNLAQWNRCLARARAELGFDGRFVLISKV
jgi:hypothetical protein